TIETIIEQQVALDESLVPNTQRLRIGRSNFRFPSDIQSKESTLQLVYDILRRCPFFKAFLVTADVPEIYMQELWAIAYVHQCSIQFKMNNKKHIVDLESFREMLHICPRIPGQAFAELPFEEEILEFIWFLRHAIINKCLTGKSFGYDSLRLSQTQILWGLYHKRSIDYAFLIWEDFVYQVEHKNQKKSNEMYYPRFTKVIIHHFMSKDPSIPRRNKINWHYVRDDSIFSTIKVVSRHQNTQQYGAMLPIELTNDEIRNIKAYKEYYACATGGAAPKPKASARRKMSGSDTSITPPTATTTPTTTVAVTPRLTTAAKGKQPAKAKSPSDPSEVARTEAQQLKIVLRRSRQQTHISQLGGSGDDAYEKVSDDDEGDEGNDSEEGEEDDDDEDKNGDERDDDDQEVAKHDDKDDTEESGDVDKEGESDDEDDNEETMDEESFDPILWTPESSKNEGNGEEDQEMELKKILIEKMEGNKSIQCSDEQRNLYKALVDAYEVDKTILDSYGETVILKRRCDDEDDQEEGPSVGSDRGSKRRREGKEPESASAPLETAIRSAGRSTTGSKSRQLRVDTLTLELLAGPTYELMKGSCQQYPHNLLQPLPLIPDNQGRRVIPFAHFINNDLEYLRGDLHLGVESYQKRLNHTKPDTYRPDLKRREAYTAYLNPKGLIYQNKDKKNKLMRIDELHNISDGTLNDVRNALDDHLKGIRM
nr:hypothetical protein [Tanacetum cinerariifolium]